MDLQGDILHALLGGDASKALKTAINAGGDISHIASLKPGEQTHIHTITGIHLPGLEGEYKIDAAFTRQK